MDQEWKTTFFKALSKQMETFTSDNLLMKNETSGEWMLKTMFATSPEQESFVMVQGITYPAREDVLLLELYIKLTDEVRTEALPELEKAIAELNAYLPVGVLGISPADQHLYLRDCFKLRTDAETDVCVDDAIVDYELLMEVVVAAYPGLSQIWSGAMSFEQVVAADLLRRYSQG